MAHDQTFRSRRASLGGTLVGVFLGLVLGVVVAFGVAWYITKTPLPFLNKEKSAQEKSGEAKGTAADPNRSLPQQPVALPGKPGDKAADKPRFEFYKILPGAEEAAPGAKPEQKPAPPPPEQLFLQVGAFTNPSDADNLKAKLALLGLEAQVLPVSIPDKGTVHRVRIGPYTRVDDMNSARTQLAQNGVQATVVKGSKDGAPR